MLIIKNTLSEQKIRFGLIMTLQNKEKKNQ